MSLRWFIALLRGVNVSGNNPVAMAALRWLCSELGWEGVRSYINSGNLLFKASGAPASMEAGLERAIQARFSLAIPVFVRAAEDWRAYAAGNPFPEASRSEPERVALVLSKAQPEPGAAEALRERARAGEQVILAGDALWIYYPGGLARSKLTPALLDRLVGSPTTGRNWRTVLKLCELLQLAEVGI